MKMRFFKCTLVIVCLLLNLSVKAYDFESGGIYYDITSENYLEVSVTSSDDSKYTGDIIIPETVEYNSKTYSVISIGLSAFTQCINLTSITLPNSVTSIKENAFYECIGLTSITLSNNVASIEGSAFVNCMSLTSITLPNSLISIKEYTFYGCESLTSITLPNSITSIGDFAFSKCTGLTSITFPNSLTSIKKYTFDGCVSLTSITLPNSITSIGDFAFTECTDLTSITFPNSLTNIGHGAFQDCKKMVSVTFPDNIKNMEPEVFSRCIKLESVILPSTITEIPEKTFEDCSSLKTINFPDNLKSIGNNSFRNCSALESIELPMGLQSIGSEAFFYCTRLQEIIVHKSLPPSIDENTFIGVDYQNCKLYAPLNSKENFSKATGWMNFTNIIEDAAFGKHLLTVTVNQGGKVAVLDEEVSNATVSWNVQSDKQVTFTFTPDDKYKINEVLLNKKDITNELSSNSYTIEKLAEDVVLEVTFAENTYAITASANEEQGIILVNGEKTATKILKEGDAVQFTIIPLNGYYTERVLLGEEDVTSQLSNNTLQIDNLNSDLNLVVTFKLFTYNIAVTCNSAEGKVLINGKETESASIKEGEEVTFTVIPHNDYVIQQVMLGDEDITSQLVNGIYTLSQVTEETSLAVTFKQIEVIFFTITTSANEEQGMVLVNGEKTATKILKEGDTVQFTIIPLNGYYTERVLLGEEDVTSQLSSNTLQIDNLNSDLNLVVTFKLFTYNTAVTCDSAEGKVLINGKETESASIKEGEEVTFTIIPHKGYAIQQVMLGDKDVTSQLVNGIYTLSQVTEDMSLAVTFKQIEVETVSFAIRSSEGGSLKQEIPVGSSTAYQIFPTENWKINTITFNGVDVTSELVDNRYTTPAITENSILSVVFVKSGEGIGTSMANQIKVYASQKNIIVKGTAIDTSIQIYSTSGQMVHSSRSVDDVTTITLAESGVYLIKIENNTYKVNL